MSSPQIDISTNRMVKRQRPRVNDYSGETWSKRRTVIALVEPTAYLAPVWREQSPYSKVACPNVVTSVSTKAIDTTISTIERGDVLRWRTIKVAANW